MGHRISQFFNFFVLDEIGLITVLLIVRFCPKHILRALGACLQRRAVEISVPGPFSADGGAFFFARLGSSRSSGEPKEGTARVGLRRVNGVIDSAWICIYDNDTVNDVSIVSFERVSFDSVVSFVLKFRICLACVLFQAHHSSHTIVFCMAES